VLANEKQLRILGLPGWGLFNDKLKTSFESSDSRAWTVVVDMGPDNLCECGYMCNKTRLRLSYVFGALHKVQRIMYVAAVDKGKYTAVLIGVTMVSSSLSVEFSHHICGFLRTP